MDSQALGLLPVWYVAFLLSLTCHEAAHAFAARLGGDETAYLSGQASLSPWPHIRREPLGTIVVPLLTYWYSHWMMGWASAPYDPFWADRHPARAAGMSAAGPAANFLLFALAFVAMKAGLHSGIWVEPAQGALAIDHLVAASAGTPALVDGLGRLLSVIFALNLILGTFNLMPFPPLDGGAVLAGIVPPIRSLYQRVQAVPSATFVGLIIAWTLAPRVINPVLRLAVETLLRA